MPLANPLVFTVLPICTLLNQHAPNPEDIWSTHLSHHTSPCPAPPPLGTCNSMRKLPLAKSALVCSCFGSNLWCASHNQIQTPTHPNPQQLTKSISYVFLRVESVFREPPDQPWELVGPVVADPIAQDNDKKKQYTNINMPEASPIGCILG